MNIPIAGKRKVEMDAAIAPTRSKMIEMSLKRMAMAKHAICSVIECQKRTVDGRFSVTYCAEEAVV